MMLELLKWDTDFFGIKIGRILFDSTESRLTALLDKAKKQGYRLVYVFSDENRFLNSDILGSSNGKLVDRKIVYQKRVCSYDVLNEKTIYPYTSSENTEKLLDLAYISGKYSRFRLDENFPIGSFERMYKEWLLKSLNGELADVVYLARENNKVSGFVTLRCGKDSGDIGLIAVNTENQNKGIGAKLIHACEEYLYKKSIDNLKVPTQMDNIQACRFYEKCGFVKISVTNIYHFWV